MSSETKKVKINVKNAERLLGEAITALDKEDHKLAMEKVERPRRHDGSPSGGSPSPTVP